MFLPWGKYAFYLTIKTSLHFTSKSLDSIHRRTWFFFFSALRWPWGLQITSRTRLKVLHCCSPHSCHLLLVEWMTSSLTPQWAMRGLLMLKFNWNNIAHPHTGWCSFYRQDWVTEHYFSPERESSVICSAIKRQNLDGGSLCGFIKCSFTFYFLINLHCRATSDKAELVLVARWCS